MAKSQPLCCSEMSLAVIHPDAVGSPIIVADVQVRKAVSIEIPECGCQPPIQRRTSQSASLFVQKGPGCPGHTCEMAFSIIQIHQVGLTIFHEFTVDEH